MDVLRREFERHDRGKLGVVSEDAFKKTLGKFGVQDGLVPLLKKFGAEGTINYKTFIEYFDKVVSTPNEKPAKTSFGASREVAFNMSRDYSRVMTQFEAADIGGKGIVSQERFESILKDNNITDLHAINAMGKQLAGPDGNVDYRQFTAVVVPNKSREDIHTFTPQPKYRSQDSPRRVRSPGKVVHVDSVHDCITSQKGDDPARLRTGKHFVQPTPITDVLNQKLECRFQTNQRPTPVVPSSPEFHAVRKQENVTDVSDISVQSVDTRSFGLENSMDTSKIDDRIRTRTPKKSGTISDSATKSVLANEIVSATNGNIQLLHDQLGVFTQGKKCNTAAFRGALSAVFPNGRKLAPWLLDKAVSLSIDQKGEPNVEKFLQSIGIQEGNSVLVSSPVPSPGSSRVVQSWNDHHTPKSRNPLLKGPICREEPDSELLFSSHTYHEATSPRHPHTDSGRNIIACDVSDGRSVALGKPAKKQIHDLTIVSSDNVLAVPTEGLTYEEVSKQRQPPKPHIKLFPNYEPTQTLHESMKKGRGSRTPPPRKFNLLNGDQSVEFDTTASPSNAWSEDSTKGAGKRVSKGRFQVNAESADWEIPSRYGRRMSGSAGEPLKSICEHIGVQTPRGTKRVPGYSHEAQAEKSIITPKQGKKYNPKVLETTLPIMLEGLGDPESTHPGEVRLSNLNSTASPAVEAKMFAVKGKKKNLHHDNHPLDGNASDAVVKEVILNKLEEISKGPLHSWERLTKAAAIPSSRDATLSASDISQVLQSQFNLHVTPTAVASIFSGAENVIDKAQFVSVVRGRSPVNAVRGITHQPYSPTTATGTSTHRSASVVAPYATENNQISEICSSKRKTVRRVSSGYAGPVPPFAVGQFGAL